MPFNLLTSPFLPVVTRDGDHRWTAVPELLSGDAGASGQTDDYPVEFDWPRADFNMASFELVLGILLLALEVRSEGDWRNLWNNPPTPDELAKNLTPFSHAFNLIGDGPLFLQDFEAFEGEPNAIEALLIDTPGQNGQRKNADLLTHRDRYDSLGLPAAAIALYAIQAYAPSGGAGNRTSMRGGGPFTALVIPMSQDEAAPVPLWRKILANVVPCETPLRSEDLPRVLPWLAPALVSTRAAGGREIHMLDEAVHPLQAYFGMPRRLRLVMSQEEGLCAMTGMKGPLMTGFVQKPYGVNYGIWRHPLTPYRHLKENDDGYSAKPKSGRFGYRDFVAATIAPEQKILSRPSKNVDLARRSRSGLLRQGPGSTDARLRIGGWAMNNMEAVAYALAEQPLHLTNSERQDVVDDTARRFSDAADKVQSALRYALKTALFSNPKAGTDGGVFDRARIMFYDETEDAFHEAIDAVTVSPLEKVEWVARKWQGTMRRRALSIFDTLAPIPPNDVEHAGAITNAYRFLNSALLGKGKTGFKILEDLLLPLPEPTKKEGKPG